MCVSPCVCTHHKWWSKSNKRDMLSSVNSTVGLHILQLNQTEFNLVVGCFKSQVVVQTEQHRNKMWACAVFRALPSCDPLYYDTAHRCTWMCRQKLKPSHRSSHKQPSRRICPPPPSPPPLHLLLLTRMQAQGKRCLRCVNIQYTQQWRMHM